MRANKRYHSGFTVLEVTLAMTVLLAASVLLSQFLIAAKLQRRVGDQRRLALEELSNRMERVLAAKWEDVNTDAIESQLVSPLVEETLPAAKLTALVSDEPGPPRGKKIRLEISWEQGASRVSPLGLTSWRYAEKEDQP